VASGLVERQNLIDEICRRINILYPWTNEQGNTCIGEQPPDFLYELKQVAHRLEVLSKISKSLRHLDECDCNTGLTQRQETRRMHLEAEAQEIANFFGLIAYHQRDPRGCSLYLVDDANHDTSNGCPIS
jgi:hypothetical protein